MQIVYIAPKKSQYSEIIPTKQKKVMACLSGAIVICLISIDCYAKDFNANGVKARISGVGNQLVDVVQFFIYWITLLCALIDIAKSVKKQDIAGVGAIVVKYGAMMGAGYSMPWIWSMIKDLFV